MRGARTTSTGLWVVLALSGCEGKGGGASAPARGGEPAATASADAPAPDAARAEPEDGAEPGPDAADASASHVGHVAGKIGDRTIRFDVLAAEGNNVAPFGRAWSAVLTAHPEFGSTERIILRLQGFDFAGLAGGKPIAPQARRQRGHVAALSYTDPSGKTYGGHIGHPGTVTVTIDTWDPSTLHLTGTISGTVRAKDDTTLAIESATFEIRRK